VWSFAYNDVISYQMQEQDSSNLSCAWTPAAGEPNAHRLRLTGHRQLLGPRCGGQTNADGAWYYLDPFDAAANIRGHVAFWKGVEVER
jgi:hypothetical protein